MSEAITLTLDAPGGTVTYPRATSIAALPALLAACESLCRTWDPGDTFYSEPVRKALAALHQAETGAVESGDDLMRHWIAQWRG